MADDNSMGYQLNLANSVLQSVSVGLIVIDGGHKIALWNEWMESHSTWPAGTVLNRNFYEVLPELRGKRIQAAVEQALESNFPSILSQSLHKSPFPLFTNSMDEASGERMQQAVSVTPIDVTGMPRHCMIQITDVSFAVSREKLLREQANQLRSQTFLDGLTGIANRRQFDSTVEKEVRRTKRAGSVMSLLMVDIDLFKSYNDEYGHQRGDDCLIQVSQALALMMRRPSDLVARYGGEEFALILPDTDGPSATLMAQKILSNVAALGLEHAKSSVAPWVTVSIGVGSMGPDCPADVDELILMADRALSKAKEGGRNRVES